MPSQKEFSGENLAPRRMGKPVDRERAKRGAMETAVKIKEIYEERMEGLDEVLIEEDDEGITVYANMHSWLTSMPSHRLRIRYDDVRSKAHG